MTIFRRKLVSAKVQSVEPWPFPPGFADDLVSDSPVSDDELAYTIYQGMVGRSIRRGIRKGIKVISFGLVGRAAAAPLAMPTAKERPKMDSDDNDNDNDNDKCSPESDD